MSRGPRTRSKRRPNGYVEEAEANADEPLAKRRRLRGLDASDIVGSGEACVPALEDPRGRRPVVITASMAAANPGASTWSPIEFHAGDKRVTRRSLHGPQATPPTNKYAATNGHAVAAAAGHGSPRHEAMHLPRSASTSKAAQPKTPAAAKPSHTKVLAGRAEVDPSNSPKVTLPPHRRRPPRGPPPGPHAFLDWCSTHPFVYQAY